MQEATQRSGWDLLAYVVMSNHYHLLIHTPRGNLVSGMQWLQSTFANRFNRFHKSRGHLFQGRYKSLIVEPGKSICAVADYIHLNPVRAKMVGFEEILNYRWSSLHFLRKRKRPEGLSLKALLEKDFGLRDSSRGWKKYLERLALQASLTPKEQERWKKQVCRGWCVGSPEFKKALLEDFTGRDPLVHFEDPELRQANETHWELLLEKGLSHLKLRSSDLVKMKKSDVRKIVLAAWLKERCSAKNSWLAEHLSMGHPASMSSLLSKFRKHPSKEETQLSKKLKTKNYAT